MQSFLFLLVALCSTGHQPLSSDVIRVDFLMHFLTFSLRCAFKSVNMLHEYIQIPTTLAWNIGCEAGVHVQCTLSMTIRAAMRRRVMGLGECWVMRRWRLASEKESWCGCRFSVSSTSPAPESWPAAAAESAKGGPNDGKRRAKKRALLLF